MKTLGQIAYEVYCEIVGDTSNWNSLVTRYQVAWNETAVVIQRSHHFMTRVKEPGESATELICVHKWTKLADGTKHCIKCGTNSKVVEETITDSVKLKGGGTG